MKQTGISLPAPRGLLGPGLYSLWGHRELPLYRVLRRWDEKADPPYAVPLEGLQMLYGLLRPIERRIGPPWMLAKSDRRRRLDWTWATGTLTCASSTPKAAR